MERVKCVRCNHEVVINISQAVDEDGEQFMCPNCGFIFRYTNK